MVDRAFMFNVTDCRETCGHFIYKVVKYRVSGNMWHVSHFPSSDEFRCSCQRMESFRLPCAHVVALLVFINIDDLPKSLVLDRWTKGAKDGF